MAKRREIRNSTAEFLIFQIEGKEQGIEVYYKDKTVWCTQKAMGMLFDCSTDNIGLHLKNIFASGELVKDSVTEKISATASDGKNYMTQFYNLDAVISVGYRVNSIRATQFRQWATSILREYAIRGYVLDRKRMEKFVDFAPFKDGKFVESELGLIPEEWRVGKLEEMASVVGSGGTPKSSVKEYYNGDILWYGTGEFNDSFIFDSEKHISQEAINNSSAKIFPIHTVLIAMYGATVGKLAILSNEASFNQAALGIVAADSIGFPFIYLTLLACRKQLIRLACGAAQQNLNAGTIKSHLTIIPNDNTMMLFNDLILPIFEKVECLQKESSRLSTLRDTLLPKLMSGQIKL